MESVTIRWCIPIGGADFDFEQWASKNDTKLLHFNALNRKDKIRNAQIKEMQAIANSSEIKVLGDVWTPPREMRAKKQWNGGHSINAEILSNVGRLSCEMDSWQTMAF